jgi:hypothetical protein
MAGLAVAQKPAAMLQHRKAGVYNGSSFATKIAIQL